MFCVDLTNPNALLVLLCDCYKIKNSPSYYINNLFFIFSFFLSSSCLKIEVEQKGN